MLMTKDIPQPSTGAAATVPAGTAAEASATHIPSQDTADNIPPEILKAFREQYKDLLATQASDAELKIFLVEHLKSWTILGYISPHHFHADNFADFLYQVTRGLDENIFTPLRNAILFAFDNQWPDIDHFNFILLSVSVPVVGLYLYAEYHRNKERAYLRRPANVAQAITESSAAMTQHLTPLNEEQLDEVAKKRIKRNELLFAALKNDDIEKEQLHKATAIAEVNRKLKKTQDKLFGHNRYLPLLFDHDERLQLIQVNPETLKLNLKETPTVTAKPPKVRSKRIQLTRIEKWITSLRSTRIGKIIEPLWDTMNTYGMWYWIAWMVAWGITGAMLSAAANPLTIALVFGIPAFVASTYLIWKAAHGIYHWITNGKKTVKIDEEDAEHQHVKELTLLYYRLKEISWNIRLHYKITKANNKNITNDEKTTISDAEKTRFINALIADTPHIKPLVNETKPENSVRGQQIQRRFDRIFGRHTLTANERIMRAAAFGFLSGIILSAINFWVVTDFLTIILDQSWAAYGLSAPWALGIAFVFALAVGTYIAFSRAADEKSAINQHYEKIDGIEQKLSHNQNCRIKSLQNFKEIAIEVETKENRIAKIREILIARKLNHPDKKADYDRLLISANTIEFSKFDGQRKKLFGIELETDGDFTSNTGDSNRVWNLTKKVIMRFLALVDGGGSGLLSARFMVNIFVGIAVAVVSMTVPALPPFWPLLITGIVLGIVIGIAKLYRHHQNKKLERDNRFLDQVQIRAKCLEEELRIVTEQENYLVTEFEKIEYGTGMRAEHAPSPLVLTPVPRKQHVKNTSAGLDSAQVHDHTTDETKQATERTETHGAYQQDPAVVHEAPAPQAPSVTNQDFAPVVASVDVAQPSSGAAVIAQASVAVEKVIQDKDTASRGSEIVSDTGSSSDTSRSTTPASFYYPHGVHPITHPRRSSSGSGISGFQSSASTEDLPKFSENGLSTAEQSAAPISTRP